MPKHDATTAIERRELQSLLDEELNRLPNAYREPLILCYLQGKTHAEAARLLGWPIGSMSSRLAAARDKLRARLSRRGLSTSAGLFAAILFANTARASVPRALVEGTVRAAMVEAAGKATTTAAFAAAMELASSVRRDMCLHALKVSTIVAASMLAMGLIAVGTAFPGLSTGTAAQVMAETGINPDAESDPQVLAASSAQPLVAADGAGQRPAGHCGGASD